MIYKSEKSYVDEIKPIARRVGIANNYLPSVLAAQCIQETGYGGFVDHSTESMIDNRNHLGMKSSLLNDTWKDHTVWNGQSFEKITPEWEGGQLIHKRDKFRIYQSIEQCMTDFVMFLTWAKRDNGKYKYRNDVIGNPDPASTIKAVRVNGYCTDPTYDKSIMNHIKKWNLTELDEGFGMKTKKLKAPKFIDNRAASKNQVPKWVNKSDKKYIVVHYLGVCGQNFELWDNGYGATFTIAWNGDVYYTADYTAVTWQCGGKIQGEAKDGSGVAPHRFYGQCTNYNSVSIENCVKRTDNKYEGDDNDDKWYFTEETQESLVWAVSKMMDDLNIPIERVIRHFDVTGKICPNPYVRNNGKNGNWTWEQFIANLKQYRKDGTITLYNGADPKPQPAVEKWYRIRKSWADAASQIGAYKSLDNAKENCPKGYAVYDWNGKEVYRPAVTFADEFLNECQNIVDTARIEKWTYGDSHTTQPCADHVISCDRLPSRANYDLGYTDQRQGGETCGTLPDWLPKHGWVKVTDRKKIVSGAIVAVRKKDQNFINHVFVVKSYNVNTDMCDKYDEGSNERIKTVQPFKSVPLVEWSDRVFVCAWNPPSDKPQPTPKPDDRTWNGVDYAPVYNYTYYKKKYPDLQKAFGNDKAKYFDHFCHYGMKECRQASSAFNVKKYKERYADLRKAFGDNYPEYYKHYCVYGKKEGRKGN